jgi:AcrR family transcriptional regulator
MPRRKSTAPGRRRPTQARSRALVDDILEATAQVLRSEGVDAATTNAIAERAGVSIGSVYQYFPNKRALFEELAARHVAALRAHADALWPVLETMDVRQVFRAAVEGMLALAQVDPALHSVLQRSALAGRGNPDFRAFTEDLEGRVAALIRLRADEAGSARRGAFRARCLRPGWVGDSAAPAPIWQ